ncbi:MAG: Hpt domain-containing protein, partial [Candidatus Marinimicrobia bacterium]|nr:Hpt domain-containing protein [Candidatus Neomarinimicrobiota bacterium]
MANENIVLELVEEISEALVFLELEDVQSIASVHSLFEKLTSKLVKKEDQHKVSLAIEDLLKDLLMEDVEDIPAALTYINSCMSAFQSIYRDGIINNDVVFPELASAGDNTGLKLPNNVDESIFMEFIGRQETDLHEFESKIMDLDSGSVEEMIPELKRFIHTLKGESGLMGLSDSEAVCHKIEDIIENGFTPNLIDLLLQVKDWLLNYFSYYTGEITTKITSEKILEKINNFQPGASDAAPKTQVT